MSEADTLGTFEAIVDVDTLTDFIGVQKAIVNEARWQVQDDGILVRAVDPANVCMVEARLHTDAFDHYEPGDQLLGIDLDTLEGYATASSHGELVNLLLDPETRMLHVDRGRTDFDMALIDPDNIRKDPDIPNLDLTVDATIDGSDLHEAIDAADLVSDHVTLTTESGDLTATASGDTDTMAMELATDVEPAGESGRYSQPYLDEIATPIPADAEVRIRFRDDYPLKISYAIDEGGIEVLNMLAPRIQSD